MSQEVQDMFGRIADRYDRTNAVLSFGIHKGWRRQLVRQSGAAAGDHVLDVATGTGDVAFLLKKVVGEGEVEGVDFTPEMLQVAVRKAVRRDLDVAFSEGDCMDLIFPDDSFDATTIAFGIRNVDDPVVGLRELARVTKPGGRVAVLEFGQPKGPLGATYRWYSKHVMPRVGGWITGDRSAYEYLPETASKFPAGSAFVEVMKQAHDFQAIEATPLTGGVAWCYSGAV